MSGSCVSFSSSFFSPLVGKFDICVRFHSRAVSCKPYTLDRLHSFGSDKLIAALVSEHVFMSAVGP